MSDLINPIPNIMNKRIFLELFLVLLITAGAAVFYFHSQQVIDYDSCKLCDAHNYAKIYDYFKGYSSYYKVNFPFSGRPFVPMLASVFPYDIVTNFELVNFIFFPLIVTVIYLLWRKLNFPIYLIGIGLFWLLFHWVGLIRFNQADPIAVDVPVYFFHTLFIFVFLSKKYKWLWVLGPVAVLQKELIIVYVLFLFIYLIVLNLARKEKKYVNIDVLIALVLCIVIKSVYGYFFPAIRPDHGSIRTVLSLIIECLKYPMRFPSWFVAVFMAFGFLILLCFKKIKQKHIYDELGGFLFLTTLVAILLGLIGGGDHTRIIFLGFPFIMTFILWVLKDVDPFSVVITLIASIPFMMLFTNNLSWEGPEYIDIGRVAGWGIYIIGGGFVLDRIEYFKKFIFTGNRPSGNAD